MICSHPARRSPPYLTRVSRRTDDHDRRHPSQLDSERADLLAELATARVAIVNTVRDLTDEQAGTRTVSALCLGGLIKHVAAVEEGWMRFVQEGPSAMTTTCPMASPGPTS